MKQLIILTVAVVMSTFTFAKTPSAEANTLSKLGSAWKAHPSIQLQTQNDITIVYGGADIRNAPTTLHTTTT